MTDLAWNKNIINENNRTNTIIHFIDDDTFPGNTDLVIQLSKHFDDPYIGGVTTSQYVKDPQYFWQHVMQVFEMARNYGSQACLSLFGSVGCLPGRWYCVRANHITPEFAKRLSEETISFFGYLPRVRDPGDDRFITIEVQKSDKLTIMEPSARVYTLSPRSFKKFWGMVTRWARSSNIYTIQSTFGWPKNSNLPYITIVLVNIFSTFYCLHNWAILYIFNIYRSKR